MAEKVFRRTPSGRPLTEFAVETLGAAIEDQKNHNQDAMKCINCKFIASSLLFSEGCPNCGLKQDLTTDISKAEILKGE